MQFHMLRLSLVERRQMSLFAISETGTLPRREAWLRQIFGKPFSFQHRASTFYYNLAPDVASPTIIVGRVGRSIVAQESAPPTEGMIDIEREGWQASLVLIDPRPQAADGQRVAFERKQEVGGPLAVFESVTAHFNAQVDHPYFMEVAPISDESDFWRFVEEHKTDIVSVTFEVFAPNGLFSSHEDFASEMRELKEREKARKVTIKLDNENGLNLDTPGVRAAAENAAKGGGAVRARTRYGLRFNSKSRVRGETVDEEQGETTNQVANRAISALFRNL